MKNNFITKVEDIKERDVFKFHYSDEMIKQKSFDSLHHCFDGILIPFKKHDGDFSFADTYWGGGEIKFKSFHDLLDKGNITLICNMDEVEMIEERELKYYKSEDIFNLSRQHGCYKRFFKKIGSTKNKEVILNLIEDKEKEIQNKMESLKNELSRLKTLKNNIPVLENLDNVWL